MAATRKAKAAKKRPAVTDREPRHRQRLGLLLTAATAVVLGAGYLAAPREHAPLPAVARYALTTSLPDWKLLEPVNEVVYGSRGFDTFGETFLLLAAVVSVIVLTRPREARRGYFGEHTAGEREQQEIDPVQAADAEERQTRAADERELEGDGHPQRYPDDPDAEPLGIHGPERAESLTVVTRTAIRLAAPVLAVTGCYLVAWGYSPGGGFPGGAVLLGVLLLAYAGFGRRRIARVVRPAPLETAEMAGALLIIGTELLGLLLKGSFSANWLPLTEPGTIRSGGIVQLFSVGEFIEVGTGLSIAVFALLGVRRDWTREQHGDGQESDGSGEGGGSS
ncbi:MnhB domain-containing protein [Actinospica sp.]|jgi:multicomponent Na+:H+ antiporter subunit B|uniref:MnhB domain-containing protein n=1 Tax=Actinospica sp. TaxID=1872142 RepID=UPI002BC87E74|nr:MnhB domain-containing protein [Actinospica sp.]HWG23696.1 MnhB domain-containing protein [Actinospica sp.]